MGPWDGRVEVAAVNGPSSVVVAGDAEALDEALEALSGEGVRVRRVAVDYASHTRHVEEIRGTLAEALAEVTAQAPVVPFYSTVTGGWVEDAGVLNGGYWYRNLRGPGAFRPGGGRAAAARGTGCSSRSAPTRCWSSRSPRSSTTPHRPRRGGDRVAAA